MKSNLSLFVIFTSALFLISACGTTGDSLSTSPTAPETSALTVASGSTDVAMIAATTTQCPAGGEVMEIFKDANNNGMLDANETVVSSTPICNGANGAAGISTGVLAEAAATGSCPNGGTSLYTFQDLNNNGLLDSNETVTSSSTICNGTNGTNGTNGSNGTNGTNGTNGSNAYLT
jgi:hypothetical protein